MANATLQSLLVYWVTAGGTLRVPVEGLGAGVTKLRTEWLEVEPSNKRRRHTVNPSLLSESPTLQKSTSSAFAATTFASVAFEVMNVTLVIISALGTVAGCLALSVSFTHD